MTNSQRKKITPKRENYWGTNLYVIRKYVYAKSAFDAFKIESDYPADEVFLDEGFKGEKIRVGFIIDKEDNKISKK